MDERSVTVRIGEEDYDLLLTTRATKEIAKKYGGLESLGDKLMKEKDFERSISEVVWLVTLLANQSIMIHNLRHKEAPRELLTEDVVELLTSPSDFRNLSAAILSAISAGTKQNVESEGTSEKNAAVGQ